MQITSSSLRDLHQGTLTSDAEGLYRSGWHLEEVRQGEDIEQTQSQPAIIDSKAAYMFELYARQGTTFAWRNMRSHLILLAWLANTQIQQNMKRALDLSIALGSLPLVLPIMIFTAIAIKLDTPGPVIFRQERIGKWGRRFICYKLRSMYMDADARKVELMSANDADEVVFKMRNDPRVTRVGRVIRRLSIDELPQIFNVIRGDMSLVGPRPPVPVELESYPFDAFLRLETIPGVTGLQQVSGRSDLPFKRWVALDVEYIRDQCLKKDIEILFKTIPVALSGKGAY